MGPSRRITGRVSTVSWIPSESVVGAGAKAAFATVAHYDPPPPDRIDGADTAAQRATLEAWRSADRFRFANQLAAWIDVDAAGRVTASGHDGAGLIGSTTVGIGGHGVTWQAVPMPIVQRTDGGGSWVRFTQSSGGRTGAPMPRRVDHPPFVRWHAPLVWTTLSLTLHADGGVEHEIVGASPFPRHWLYDGAGELAQKVGSTDYARWYRRGRPADTPWGGVDSPALVTAVESALERSLSTSIMQGGRTPTIRRVRAGRTLVEQGAPGDEIFVLLDGALAVEVDGAPVAEVGPGAIVGERAALEAGVRTSTLRAVVDCKVAATAADRIGHDERTELAALHRRESGAT